jgi:glycosyltransferase domain-containing protein
MKKNIEYFSKFQDCQIYICDSTEIKYLEEFPCNITYIHMPNKSFIEKMYQILSDVESEYVAVCADDDFIIESTTLNIVSKIRSENYVMGVGRYAGFDLPFEGFYNIYKNLPKVESKIPFLRVVNYLSNYHMSLWAVYKKSSILKCYEILKKSNITNSNLIELTIAINSAIDGKILFTEEFYGVREVNNSNSENWAKQHLTLLGTFKRNRKLILNEIKNLSINSSNKKLFIIGFYIYLFDSFKNRIKNKFFNNKKIKKESIIDEKLNLLITKIIKDNY